MYAYNIHTKRPTKHDKTEHTWKYTYIKSLRPDRTKQSNIRNQILGYVDNTMG